MVRTVCVTSSFYTVTTGDSAQKLVIVTFGMFVDEAKYSVRRSCAPPRRQMLILIAQ